MRRFITSVSLSTSLFLTTFVVLGAAQLQTQPPQLTLIPSSGPKGSIITVVGENFTGGGSVAADGITVEDFPAGFETSTLTSDGGFAANNIRVGDFGLGPKTVRVTDSGGLVGSAVFTVTRPTITISPTSATMGEIVSITGAGWVPMSVVFVSLKTNYLDLATNVATADAGGRFETVIELPNAVGIGTKVISFHASDLDYLGNTATEQELTVPAPKVSLSANKAEVGSFVTLDASGFLPSSALSVFTIGDLDIREGVLTTDLVGRLSVSFEVPGLTGGQLVAVNIGGTKVSTSIFVENTIATPPPDAFPETAVETPTVHVFAHLIANDNNLVRIFRFDNYAKTWDFFDPRPEFIHANSLTTTKPGNIVWVNILSAQEFQGRVLFAGWNQISLK